jgi:hypothetical protein
MDLFVVPTFDFEALYAFVIIRLDRRDLVWVNVTTNPTAEWVARQLTEAFPWDGRRRHPRWAVSHQHGLSCALCGSLHVTDFGNLRSRMMLSFFPKSD